MTSFFPAGSASITTSSFSTPYNDNMQSAFSYLFDSKSGSNHSANLVHWRNGNIQIYQWNGTTWNLSINTPYTNINQLWDTFYDSNNTLGNTLSMIDAKAYVSNPSYYNDLFGSHLKDFFELITTSGSWPANNAALLTDWQNYLDQVGVEQATPSTETVGPFGIKDPFGIKNTLTATMQERKRNGAWWVIQSLQEMITSINRHVSNISGMMNKRNGMVEATTSIDMELVKYNQKWQYWVSQAVYNNDPDEAIKNRKNNEQRTLANQEATQLSETRRKQLQQLRSNIQKSTDSLTSQSSEANQAASNVNSTLERLRDNFFTINKSLADFQ